MPTQLFPTLLVCVELTTSVIRSRCLLHRFKTVATAKRHDVERHFSSCHNTFNASYSPGSSLEVEEACELKAALGKQQSFFTRSMKKSQAAMEASFRAAYFLTKSKKTFSEGDVLKGAMTVITNALFKDEKNGPEVIAALSDVQFGASTIAGRVSTMSEDLTVQLDRDLSTCRWFSIQCDETVDTISTVQLIMFVQMVFDDISTN
ncbi:hypothetical protein F2P81_025297 [Scophthalmus maximus]|uniref:DUF4371 domain-containing protein n=1 Tax=Scophthalmus maximus TaxID=52904 RepID=A0A6A4RVE8_SCOMX|nr:hypothetical protein F2P81_025297 [Scophthalmus maximus]